MSSPTAPEGDAPRSPPRAHAGKGFASHTRSLSVKHTRSLSRTGAPLTAVPAELPQLTVTTPTTAYTSDSAVSIGEDAPPVPPMQLQIGEHSPPPSQIIVMTSPPVTPGLPSSALSLPPTPPAVTVTTPTPGSTPTPMQTKFASPAMANPNAPVLPRLATPGAAHLRTNTGGNRPASPPKLRVNGVTGGLNTMSPVVAARNFNMNRPAANPSQLLNSSTKGRGELSQPDRVVGRETLFDLDADEGGDARELPLDDLLQEELPEYIQVYLTPHPDQDDRKEIAGGKEKDLEKGGDEKKVLSEKDEQAWRAAKWSDIEATLPAYTSKASLKLKRSATGSSSSTASSSGSHGKDQHNKKKTSLLRRIIPRKPSTRLICFAIIFLICIIVPLVIFGIAYSIQQKAHHNNTVPLPAAQTITGEENGGAPPPIVGPMAGSQVPDAGQQGGPPAATIGGGASDTIPVKIEDGPPQDGDAGGGGD